ncbi:class I SAM-dependent methyltransferase [Galbitalea sp. SE-J8]|uniref:class I SAM-dependent methyltransferase n=1 Tax=Galbitalea sp. SE-J8 TaxID=3054952 RepID=UPI00259CEB27|nr:class I SAM-dependent methyltransferase [Galbitalea sp. SE-J8]MDM4761443.1 class I SAM-dependent methyltransferase [Galbitalea sp. SE-J8]
MDAAELTALLTPEALALLDELPPYEATTDVLATVSALRAAGHPPERVAAVLTQARLRRRARTKFGPFAAQLLFTEAGLEQATRLPVAALHAGRFRDAGLARVADLGCGIGADALSLAALDLDVLAVERDPVTAAIAAYNLAPWPDADVIEADAADVDLSGRDGVWLDPARRANGRRSHDPADWSPSLDLAFGLALPTGVKLGPGIDRELLPAGTEAQWVSVDGDVVEVAVWTRELARPGVGRAALVLQAGRAAELTAAADSDDVAAGPLGAYLYEPDGAVIRARLIGDLARSLDARMLHPSIAYLTADEPRDTPFARRFRVVDALPLDARTIGRRLRADGIGVVEIKKRGVDIDPAVFRTKLGLDGDGAAVLVLTRIGGSRRALLAQRDDQS